MTFKKLDITYKAHIEVFSFECEGKTYDVHFYFKLHKPYLQVTDYSINHQESGDNLEQHKYYGRTGKQAAELLLFMFLNNQAQ